MNLFKLLSVILLAVTIVNRCVADEEYFEDAVSKNRSSSKMTQGENPEEEVDYYGGYAG